MTLAVLCDRTAHIIGWTVLLGVCLVIAIFIVGCAIGFVEMVIETRQRRGPYDRGPQ